MNSQIRTLADLLIYSFAGYFIAFPLVAHIRRSIDKEKQSLRLPRYLQSLMFIGVTISFWALFSLTQTLVLGSTRLTPGGEYTVGHGQLIESQPFRNDPNFIANHLLGPMDITSK